MKLYPVNQTGSFEYFFENEKKGVKQTAPFFNKQNEMKSTTKNNNRGNHPLFIDGFLNTQVPARFNYATGQTDSKDYAKKSRLGEASIQRQNQSVTYIY